MEKHLNLRFLILCLSVLLCSQSVTAQKSEVEPSSKLQKIIVFTDKAMITKDASFSVKRGENVVRISGITPYLVDQSVQVSLLGQTDIAISEVTVEETFSKW